MNTARSAGVLIGDSQQWLKRALAEAAFIARDNPAAAARVVEAITSTVELLARHPALGRPGRVEGTRESVVPDTPYLVPYRVRGRAVEILRVFHGATSRVASVNWRETAIAARRLLERQAEWQKRRAALSWSEKVRMVEAVREPAAALARTRPAQRRDERPETRDETRWTSV